MRKRRNSNGFTLIEVLIVTAIIGLLASIAVPTVLFSREQAEENVCAEQAAQIERAMLLWQLDNGIISGENWIDLEDLDSYFPVGCPRTCPGGSDYDIRPYAPTGDPGVYCDDQIHG